MVSLAERVRRLPRWLDRSRRLIRQGNRARDARAFARAAEHYAEALRTAPDNAPIHIQAAHMFKESGDLASAERHYMHALAIAPHDRDANLHLAHLYKNSERPLDAYTYFLRLAEIDPDAPGRDLEHVTRQLNMAGVQGANMATAASALTLKAAEASGLVDPEWYGRRYPDIGDADPIRHFFEYGRYELRHPGPGFDPHWYLHAYPKVVASGLDPFAHYLAIGRASGLKPIGPAPYARWVAAYDTLDAADLRAIDAHIAEAGHAGPTVLVAVDADTAATIGQAIQALRAQRLKPRRVHLCLTPDCPPAARRAVRALAGSDDLFRIADAQHPFDEDSADTGIVLIDAAVELRAHALYMLVEAAGGGADLVYADHDRIDEAGVRRDPVFKPTASPELLRQIDYIGACALLPAGAGAERVAAALVTGDETIAGLIRTAALAEDAAVAHVPFILYHNHVERAAPPSPRGLRLADADLPSVTIIIPTRDRLDLLRPCIDSLRGETDYPLDLIDIVIVDNASVEDETIDWLATEAAAGHLRTIDAPVPFNYPILNNMAAAVSTADVLILLNNDTEVQDPDWLRGLMGYAMQPDVAAVGPMLLYDDGTIQHAGVVLGVGGVAAHAHGGIAHDAPGALGFAQRTREVAAVTGACLAMRRSVFEELGGLDPGLPVAFNDVLLCLSAIDRGYRNLYVHDVWLRHYESKTRGRDDTIAKVKIFNREARYAREKYPALFRNDPWYSPNLSFNLEDLYEPAFPPRVTRPWQAHKRKRQPPRALLLSETLSFDSEIGTTVGLQARFLSDRGYEVVIGAPYAVLSQGAATGNCRMLENARDAAAYAVEADVDVIVAHTPGFGEVSRWLGESPPVLLHYHGERSEAASDVAGHVFRREGRLLALPFVSRVLADSAEAAAELSLPGALVRPPGADRLGLWSSQLMPLREEVRRERGWAGRTIVLVAAASGIVDAKLRRDLDALLPELDDGKIALVLWTADQRPATNLPVGMAALAPATAAERQRLMVGADIFWAGPSGAPLDAIEAAALGLAVFDPPAAPSGNPARTIARALARTAEAAGAPDPWRRQAADQPSWAATLAGFEAILGDLHGLTAKSETAAGSILSAEALILESGLFDLEYYHARNLDLAGVDGFRHFIDNGHREGRPFSRLFDTAWYLEEYPEAGTRGGGPLLDYLGHPRGARDPNPFFSNAAYLAALGDRDTGGRAPLVHYLQAGAEEGLPVGDAFDATYYRSVYPDVAASGLPALVHFLTIGRAEGRLAIARPPSPIDLFDDAAVAAAGGAPIEDILPLPATADAVNGKTSAARFLIALLRRRADLRRRFPDALSAGPDGAFAAWLQGAGAAELGLSARARGHVAALFISDPAARVRQARLIRTDLAHEHPLALTPAGAGNFLAWAIEDGMKAEGFGREALWWFLLSAAEAPARGLVDTYLFTPIWQRLFPDGATVFGRRALAAWLAESFGVVGDWADPANWPEPFTPAEQIRIAYNARAAWQAAHPAPFAARAGAAALLAWLKTPAAGLAADASKWLARQDRAALAEALVAPGLNMLGHFCYASGLRTSTESLVEGFRRAGGDVALRDVWVQERGDENRHIAYTGLEIHDTTIIHTQPEPLFDVAYERAGLAPRTPRTYRIGYWYWELEKIPPHWQAQADEVDEIWTATKFVADALRQRFDVPVRIIMPGLEHPVFEPLPRSRFGLPEGTFLFLFTFHMASIMERKNPLGLIAAFIQAFGADDTVGLVLKTSFGHMYPEQLAELREAGEGYNVIIIDDVFTQGEVLALMDVCDSYVSLHRSEGYGLTMAEAMLLGKPVIATAYSGNLDFMSDETSLLVRFELVTLDRDYLPYKAGMRWAHASLDHAAQCMRKVRDDPVWARELGAKAKADLATRMSFEVSGRKVAARLAEIASARSRN